MVASRSSFTPKSASKRNAVFQRLLVIAIALTFLSLIPLIFAQVRGSGVHERRELASLFESSSFEQAYALSVEMLQEHPLDFFLLTMRGFSAYQLAIAQINKAETLVYIDKSIMALRKALLLKDAATDGRLYYVLGKAYFHKGEEYADLAVTYLEKARQMAFTAADIPEYLGLAYAALGDFHRSIAAFSLSLSLDNDDGPSDLLLLAIARSYLGLGDTDAAKAYLVQSLRMSKDSRTKASSRLLLGTILAGSGDVSGAESEFLAVIEESGESVDARYQLGVLYASVGDVTRARAEWRRVLRIDPAHAETVRRLNL